MKTKKLLMGTIAALLALTMVLASCDLFADPAADSGGGEPGNGVDFANYSTDATRAIYVDNDSGLKLVAFKGELSMDKIIGGIPASTQGHGLRKNPKLFDKTESFVMLLLTESQFNEHKDNLAQIKEKPFTRVFVMYNDGQSNEVHYKVSAKLGGQNELLVQNPTGKNVELRLNGVQGTIIGFVPAGLNSTTLFLDDGDVDIFPVFKAYNPVRSVVSELFPKTHDGGAWFVAFAFNSTSRKLTLNLKDAMDSVNDNRTLGAAWLKINNQTTGAIRVQRGNDLVQSATGLTYFNSGAEITIPINMPGTGGTFAKNLTIDNYMAGPTGNTTPIKDKSGKTSFTLETDKQYVVTVTGRFQQGTLKAEIDIEGAVSVNFDDLRADEVQFN